MNASTALAKLRGLGVPVLETAEAAALLGQSRYAASKTLSRLAATGAVLRVRSGTWWLQDRPDPLRVAPYLTAPLPSYVSLYSALREHGMIEQVPSVVYLVTLGRAQRLRTAVGVVSIHHVHPDLFCGFETIKGVPLASPEKALFDLAYVSGGRSALKPGLPEIELPRRFRKRALDEFIRRIPSQRGRTLTAARIRTMLAGTRA